MHHFSDRTQGVAFDQPLIAATFERVGSGSRQGAFTQHRSGFAFLLFYAYSTPESAAATETPTTPQRHAPAHNTAATVRSVSKAATTTAVYTRKKDGKQTDDDDDVDEDGNTQEDKSDDAEEEDGQHYDKPLPQAKSAHHAESRQTPPDEDRDSDNDSSDSDESSDPEDSRVSQPQASRKRPATQTPLHQKKAKKGEGFLVC